MEDVLRAKPGYDVGAMNPLEIFKTIQFLVDDHGRPLAVQIGIREWEELLERLEDQEDLAVVREALERLRAGPAASGALAWDEVRGRWDEAKDDPKP
jgi:predicted DNA-binding protein